MCDIMYDMYDMYDIMCDMCDIDRVPIIGIAVKVRLHDPFSF